MLQEVLWQNQARGAGVSTEPLCYPCPFLVPLSGSAEFCCSHRTAGALLCVLQLGAVGCEISGDSGLPNGSQPERSCICRELIRGSVWAGLGLGSLVEFLAGLQGGGEHQAHLVSEFGGGTEFLPAHCQHLNLREGQRGIAVPWVLWHLEAAKGAPALVHPQGRGHAGQGVAVPKSPPLGSCCSGLLGPSPLFTTVLTVSPAKGSPPCCWCQWGRQVWSSYNPWVVSCLPGLPSEASSATCLNTFCPPPPPFRRDFWYGLGPAKMSAGSGVSPSSG